MLIAFLRSYVDYVYFVAMVTVFGTAAGDTSRFDLREKWCAQRGTRRYSAVRKTMSMANFIPLFINYDVYGMSRCRPND